MTIGKVEADEDDGMAPLIAVEGDTVKLVLVGATVTKTVVVAISEDMDLASVFLPFKSKGGKEELHASFLRCLYHIHTDISAALQIQS